MTDDVLDAFKHNANQTLAQARRDIEAIAKRMRALEGNEPTSNDCYPNIIVCLRNTLNRLDQVIVVSKQMALREATGIRPELN